MITRENCRGVWVPILSEWDANDRFDEEMFGENARRLVAAGIHTIYTTGTDGEFYAMTREEFRRMVRALVAVTKGTATTAAIGTNAASTRDVLEQIAFCGEAGADAVMPAFPFWLEMKDAECRRFLAECCRAAGPMGVVHYNTFRAKRVFSPQDYQSLLPELPVNFVGTKAGALDFPLWCQFRLDTPELVHICMEATAVPMLMSGGRAFISATFGAMNPPLAVELHGLCVRGDWTRAIDLQLRVNAVEHMACNRILRARGYRAGPLSKAIVRVAGFLETHNRVRGPYSSVPDEVVREVREAVLRLMPELIR